MMRSPRMFSKPARKGRAAATPKMARTPRIPLPVIHDQVALSCKLPYNASIRKSVLVAILT
jgi:hypothetical protein